MSLKPTTHTTMMTTPTMAPILTTMIQLYDVPNHRVGGGKMGVKADEKDSDNENKADENDNNNENLVCPAS